MTVKTDHEPTERISTDTAIAAVRAELLSWEGVEEYIGQRGELAFRLGRRELGHVHGTSAHLPMPRRIRDELIAEGRVRPHPVMPDSGWLHSDMDTRAGLASTLELFRMAYDRAAAANARR
jgi:Family of unknown function (DUF5519)